MTNARGPLIHLGKLVKSPPPSLGEIAFGGGERERARSTYMNIAYFRSALPDRISLCSSGRSHLWLCFPPSHSWMGTNARRSLARPSSFLQCMQLMCNPSCARAEGRAMCGRKYCFGGYSYRADFSAPSYATHATYQYYHHVLCNAPSPSVWTRTSY